MHRSRNKRARCGYALSDEYLSGFVERVRPHITPAEKAKAERFYGRAYARAEIYAQIV